jgi:hypothetical protein
MRNPFPGMNPYLEDPTLWGGVHHLLMSALHQQLNQRLPEGYVALVEERIYLETSETYQHYVPDVLVARRQRLPAQPPASTAIADPPIWDYLVALHRAGESLYAGEVWFVRLSERLPRVSMPLLAEDPEVVVDLQEAVDAVYAQGRYHELLDYSVEPPVPLSDEQRAWIRDYLHAHGIL